MLSRPEPGPSHAAAIQGQGEAAFDDFGAQFEGSFCCARKQPPAVGIDGIAGVFITVPTPDAILAAWRGGFGDAGFPKAAVQFLEAFAAVLALVGDQFGGSLIRWRQAR